MNKHFHVCQNLAALEAQLMNGEIPGWLIVKEGDEERPATKQEIWENIYEAISKGYDVLPPCDNVDERGHCKGHERLK